MKFLLFILLTGGLLAQVPYKSARFPTKTVGGPSGSPYTAGVSFTGTHSDYSYFGRSGGAPTYLACTFTAATAGTLTSVNLDIAKTGSPTFTVFSAVYTDNGSGAPGTPIGSAGSINAAAFGTTEGTLTTITGLSSLLEPGPTYWLIIWTTTAPANYTDFLTWWILINPPTGAQYKVSTSSDGITWTPIYSSNSAYKGNW